MSEYKVQIHSSYSYSGFPLMYAQYLRCNEDRGELKVFEKLEKDPEFIKDGFLRCCSCGLEYPIIDGIVRMLGRGDLDEEAEHEMKTRNMEAEERPEFSDSPRARLWHKLEMDPTLSSLNPYQGAALLEFACGTGRYTLAFIGKCREIVAVDFSLVSLQVLAKKIPRGAQIGLVQADITRLAVTPRSFDRVFSTTSLDNRDQRMVMNRLAADALVDNGRYVYSTEFYDLRTRLLGNPRARRYTPGGSFFCHLERDEVIRETAPYFQRVQTRPIRIYLPFTGKLGNRTKYAISRIAERIPLARELGELLLVSADTPIRPPLEGETPAGSRIVKSVYRWYKNEAKK